VSRMEQETAAPPKRRIKKLSKSIDLSRPPKIFRGAMSREDLQKWAEAFDDEYQGIYEHGTLNIARPEPGARVLSTATRSKYKVVNRVFKKRMVLLCVMGNQQQAKIHDQFGEMYPRPLMKGMYAKVQANGRLQDKARAHFHLDGGYDVVNNEIHLRETCERGLDNAWIICL
jgi:hypothetical protein